MTRPVRPAIENVSTDDRSERVLALLEEALKLIDLEDFPAEIGARLDHVICCVREHKEGRTPLG